MWLSRDKNFYSKPIQWKVGEARNTHESNEKYIKQFDSKSKGLI